MILRCGILHPARFALHHITSHQGMHTFQTYFINASKRFDFRLADTHVLCTS